MSWIAAVDYHRGPDHRRSGVPCRDFGKMVKIRDDLVVGALSAAPHALPHGHVAAKTAVREALLHLAGSIRRRPDQAESLCESAGLFDGLLDSVRRSIDEQAAQLRAEEDEVACTLLAFVAAPWGVTALQIGDGVLACRTDVDGYDFLFRPRTTTPSRTHVMSPDAGRIDSLRTLACPVQFLCAGTAGLKPVSVRPRDQMPAMTFFRTLDMCVGTARSDNEVHQGIRQLFRSRHLQSRMEDDLTLMLCGWQQPVAA